MATTNDDDDDDDRYDHCPAPVNLREMELHHCGPGRAGNPTSGERIAILRFLCNRKPEPPIMLNLTEARRLLAKLVVVLDHYDDALGKKLSVLFFPNGEWPTDPSGDVTGSRPMPKHMARPSLRAAMPHSRLNDTDVWQLVCMLRHVDNHESFMRLIGVPDEDIRTQRRREKVIKPSSPRVKEAMKNHTRSPLSKRKRKR